MVVLGLLLLAAAGAVTLGVVLSNTNSVSAEAFGVSLSNVTVGGLFLAGGVAGAVLLLGLVLLLAGASRKRSRRVAARREVKGVRSEREQLAEENATLRAKLNEPYAGEGDSLADPAPVNRT